MKPVSEYRSVERADRRLQREIYAAIREVEAVCGERPANVKYFAVEQLRALRTSAVGFKSPMRGARLEAVPADALPDNVVPFTARAG